MDNDAVLYQKKDRVAVVTFQNPAKDIKEALLLYYGLTDICNDILSDPDIRVAVLTGSEDSAFMIDSQWAGRVLETEKEYEAGPLTFAEKIAGLDRPVIAALSGDVMGEALEAALACDIRIAAETAHFGMPQIHRGLIPGDGGTQRLSRLVGRAKATEMILTGETINAEEAHRMGLVNRVTPRGKLLSSTMRMAEEMASKSPFALNYAKEAIFKGMDQSLVQGLRLEADLYFLLHTTSDRIEGINAFKEKRKPHFKGK